MAANVSGAQFGYTVVMGDRRRQRDGALVQPVGKKLEAVRPDAHWKRSASEWDARPGWLGTGRDRRDGNRVAEVIGGAIALRIVFNLPRRSGGIITGVERISLLLLTIQGRRGQRLFGASSPPAPVIAIGRQFLRRDTTQCGPRRLAPRFQGTGGVLAAAIMGRPSCASRRLPAFRSRATGFWHPDRAAPARTHHPHKDNRPGDAPAGTHCCWLPRTCGAVGTPASIERLPRRPATQQGATIAVLFAVGLPGIRGVVDGGCYAGAMIMQGLLHWSVPDSWCAAITLGRVGDTLGFDTAHWCSHRCAVVRLSVAVLPLVKLTEQPRGDGRRHQPSRHDLGWLGDRGDGDLLQH